MILGDFSKSAPGVLLTVPEGPPHADRKYLYPGFNYLFEFLVLKKQFLVCSI